jgi:hypothetical protein|tara:strand:+ start:478 stop:672 length:195 start_codon:yes stop_codon:yes gene_type:complete
MNKSKYEWVAALCAALMILCAIISAGSIDGPAGHENDNWAQCFVFGVLMLIFGYLSIWLSNKGE